MGFTFKDINGEIYELPYEANTNYIELTCETDGDNISYKIIMDKEAIHVNESTYLAVEKYKNSLN